MLNIANDIVQTTPGSPPTPFGEFKNDAVAGDNSGTPLIEKWINDLYYAHYAVLNRAGIVPSSTKENVNTSDFMDALLTVIGEENPANFLRPRPQDVPNNTVKLSGGVTTDPQAPISEPVIMAAGLADAIVHTAVGISGEGRYDRLVHDKAGVVTKKIGVEAVSPVKPALVEGENPICSVLITTFGATPVIDNTQDIIEDERVQNRLPKLDIPTTPGNVVLAGRVNANATINKTTDFGSGASFSVSSPSTGIYDVTLAGLGAFTNVQIIPTKNINQGGTRTAFLEGVTDKTLNTGFGTPTGFRVSIRDLIHDSCGGCPFMDNSVINEPWSFIVIGLD